MGSGKKTKEIYSTVFYIYFINDILIDYAHLNSD